MVQSELFLYFVFFAVGGDHWNFAMMFVMRILEWMEVFLVKACHKLSYIKKATVYVYSDVY